MRLASTILILSLGLCGAPVRGQPPEKLRIRLSEFKGNTDELLNPTAPAWEKVASSKVLLNRTPRLYQTEKPSERKPPVLEVRGLWVGEKLIVRLRWEDPSRNSPAPPPKKTGEGGDPSKLYKQPTGETASFADAAAVMLPERWTGKETPSLVMGDRGNPARIYYWNASRGTQELTAKGRSTQTPTGKSFVAKSLHSEGHWIVTLELPMPADGCPIAFAVWDGNQSDRDGLKWFSIWYFLKKE